MMAKKPKKKLSETGGRTRMSSVFIAIAAVMRTTEKTARHSQSLCKKPKQLGRYKATPIDTKDGLSFSLTKVGLPGRIGHRPLLRYYAEADSMNKVETLEEGFEMK